MGRYLATLERAADAAARNPLIRGPLLPLARRVAAALEEARSILPRSARVRVDEALLKLEKSLGGRRLLPLRSAPKLERVALQLLEVGLRLRPKGRPIALYFGFDVFPPPVPANYLTVERLIESAPGGAEFLKHVDLKSRNVSYRDVEQMWSLLWVAEAASAQGRVDVFVKPEWFRRMFPGPAVSASAADKGS